MENRWAGQMDDYNEDDFLDELEAGEVDLVIPLKENESLSLVSVHLIDGEGNQQSQLNFAVKSSEFNAMVKMLNYNKLNYTVTAIG